MKKIRRVITSLRMLHFTVVRNEVFFIEFILMFFFILTGSLEVVKLLIENGIDINHTSDDHHETALHYAVERGMKIILFNP